MKSKLIRMLIISTMTTGTSLFFSCSGNSNESATTDPAKISEQHNDAKFDNKKDAQFLVDAAQINLQEIQLGDLANTKSTTPEVKDLGKMMSDAHTKAQSDLVALAQKKGITVPVATSDDMMKDYNSLNKEEAANFDKRYAGMMVDGHKDAISKFEKASTDCEDADIRDWASKMLPQLRAHLDHSMNCQTNLRASN